MSLPKVLCKLKTVKRCRLPNLNPSPNPKPLVPDSLISKILTISASQPLRTPSTDLLCNLTPNTLHLILSNRRLKIPKCLNFFNFLLKNQSLISFKLDLTAHLTVICRLIKAGKFAEAESLLTSLFNDENLRCPLPVIASFTKDHCHGPKIVSKLCNMMLKFYSDNRKFEEASEAFSYMANNGIEINERTCTIHLIALTKCDQLGLCLEFFYRMLRSGIEVSVFSLTVVVDGLCKSGEIKRARELVEEMLGRGIKPNIITCNTLVDACAKRWDFGELDVILVLMEKEGVDFNVETYKFLIDGFLSSGKIEEAERTVSEMHGKRFKVDTHLYTLILSGYCRLENIESALSLFGKMNERGVCGNADAYRTLVSGLCKVGQMEVAKDFVDEMQNKGIELDQVVCTALIDGYCKQGMIDKAVMEKEEFIADISVYDRVARGLCELNRIEEAKWLLDTMVKRGVTPDMLSFASLLDTVQSYGSKEALPGDGEKGMTLNVALHSDLRDEFCGMQNMNEAEKFRDEMQYEELILNT